MGVFKRREFLKGVGAVFLGQILIAKSVQAQEKEQDWFKTINRAANPDNLTATEKKHAPVIGIPGYVKTNQVFFLTVEVGRTLHVMTPNHWIMWIEVYLGNSLVSRTEFSPLSPQPSVTIPLSVGGPTTLKVMEQCNLHGIWESKVNITPV
ncbi:MAG TPA: class II SORL domain-containing protein [Candidatus Tripitaka californicus]|uniref:class II SORL domain-containing protein n=2 Tax=Candidatus Tripitaka californicus TaxID=3367616 RepID=UPI004025376C|nr:class II SORL domain-containing protein [Planctomycetota bacterium]